MLAHQLLLVTTDHLMAAGFLQTLRRAVVAFLAVVFAVGLLAGGTVGFFLGRAVGRRDDLIYKDQHFVDPAVLACWRRPNAAADAADSRYPSTHHRAAPAAPR